MERNETNRRDNMKLDKTTEYEAKIPNTPCLLIGKDYNYMRKLAFEYSDMSGDRQYFVKGIDQGTFQMMYYQYK